MGAKDYYAALGVDRTETPEGIHKAYRQLAKECHPDRVGREGTEKFQEVQEAYEVLSDPWKRQAYDARFDRQRPGRPTRPPAVEPLVPTADQSDVFGPEPLIRSARLHGSFSPLLGCTFCDGFGSALGMPCPFCGPVAARPDDLEQFIRQCFRLHWF